MKKHMIKKKIVFKWKQLCFNFINIFKFNYFELI